MIEDEMFGWHHRLNGYEFEQTLGDSERQGSLACMRLQSQTRFSNTNNWMGSDVSVNCNTVITKVSLHFANAPIDIK